MSLHVLTGCSQRPFIGSPLPCGASMQWLQRRLRQLPFEHQTPPTNDSLTKYAVEEGMSTYSALRGIK
eukprot:1096026-Amphidinium_carterae.1